MKVVLFPLATREHLLQDISLMTGGLELEGCVLLWSIVHVQYIISK